MPDRAPIRCFQCGYVLDGLRVDGVCPECGKPIWSGPVGVLTTSSSKAALSLSFGITSLAAFLCIGPVVLVLAVPGVILGHLAVADINAGRVDTGKNNAKAGLICSWIAVALAAVWFLFLL